MEDRKVELGEKPHGRCRGENTLDHSHNNELIVERTHSSIVKFNLSTFGCNKVLKERV